ncbi:MAG: DciA family protein [Pseudomonadales bacterium]
MQPNKYSHFKQFKHIQDKDSVLSKLLRKANGILSYQESVRSALEPSCRPHCWLANYRSGTLYLQSDSSAWGTRIRMQQRQLVRQLQSLPAFQDIRAVKVSIVPHAKASKPKHSTKEISAANAQQLEDIAESTEDGKLSAALHRLAKTAQRNKNGD